MSVLTRELAARNCQRAQEEWRNTAANLREWGYILATGECDVFVDAQSTTKVRRMTADEAWTHGMTNGRIPWGG